MNFTLPPLPYDYTDLEPVIDSETMTLHHTKHHQTYVDKLNAALDKFPQFQDKSLDWLLREVATLPEDLQKPVRNHGGGHANHTLFWTIMAPPVSAAKPQPEGPLVDALTQAFGSVEAFKSQFSETAANHFGSGWAWLVFGQDQKLHLYSLPNQDSPLMQRDTPLMGLDVWEHAYYLKYQNRRPEYIQNWWQVVNWPQVSRNFQIASP